MSTSSERWHSDTGRVFPVFGARAQPFDHQSVQVVLNPGMSRSMCNELRIVLAPRAHSATEYFAFADCAVGPQHGAGNVVAAASFEMAYTADIGPTLLLSLWLAGLVLARMTSRLTTEDCLREPCAPTNLAKKCLVPWFPNEANWWAGTPVRRYWRGRST